MPDTTGTAQIEDGATITSAAWDTLRAHKKDLGSDGLVVGPLDAFLKDAEQNHKLSIEEKTKILDQATLMLNNLYPHLPFKLDEFHFIHPVKWLEVNVRPFLKTISELDFHGHVIAAFSLIRDAHTLYGLPSPYRTAIAFLPFQMRFYVAAGVRRYVVTRVLNGFEHDRFRPGAEIVTWAGFPVDNLVLALAGRLPGANPDAASTRGAYHSTMRPLAFCQPPREEELPATVIGYISPDCKTKGLLRIPFGVATGVGRLPAFPTAAFSMSCSHAHADDWHAVMHPAPQPPVKATPGPTLSPVELELTKPSLIPEAFETQFTGGIPKPGVVDPAVLTTDPPTGARFGYIRIKRFSDGSAVSNTDGLAQEFGRLVSLMDQVAQDGLIIDLRSNPGGEVQAAEQMLQMLTPGQIVPTRFHFANTGAMVGALQRLHKLKGQKLSPEDDAKITDSLLALGPWLQDAANTPLPSGERLTSGQTLTDIDACNGIGQIYQGRVVLLIDALTYSAAEVFAAGFQDHAIGEIIGMDHATGGGGGNVWTHDDLIKRLSGLTDLPLQPMPLDATMSIAIRRSSRVGFFEGRPVEDFGVKADITYVPDSPDDVLGDYPGLTHAACNRLVQLPPFRTDVVKFAVQPDGSVQLELRTLNVDSIDVFLDNKLALKGQAVKRRANQVPSLQTITVPAIQGATDPIAMKIVAHSLAPGANGDTLFVTGVRRIRLQAPAPPEQPSDSTDSTDNTENASPEDGPSTT